MTPTSPRKRVHTMSMPIRWGDMDAMGHVNNAAYFRYMESARIAWFDSLGITPAPLGTGPILLSASCTFRLPLTYPGDVEIVTYAGEPGRSSFQTWVEMRPSYAPGAIHADGQGKIVWVDYAAAKSIPLPDFMRRLLED